MSDEKRIPKSTGGRPPEESVGDGVAKASRRVRAASGGLAPRGTRRRTARTSKRPAAQAGDFTGEERLLILDCWMRSKLAATEFSPLVGVVPATLYAWRRRFETSGPAGLLGHKRRVRGSQLPEPTKRAILMMKEAHPDWGQDRIHDMLIRTAGIEASAGAVRLVTKEPVQVGKRGVRLREQRDEAISKDVFKAGAPRSSCPDVSKRLDDPARC